MDEIASHASKALGEVGSLLTGVIQLTRLDKCSYGDSNPDTLP